MFERVRRGSGLTKKAWAVIRSHPGLAKLPLTGGALAVVAFVVLGIPGVLLAGSDSTGSTIGGIVVLAIAAYLASFTVSYFNLALAAAADRAMRGEEPGLSAAKGVARSRVGKLAAWAGVSAGVRVVLGALRGRGGAAGRLGVEFGAEIWSLVTFLVVPVLAFEGIGPFAAMKRSAALFRQPWLDRDDANRRRRRPGVGGAQDCYDSCRLTPIARDLPDRGGVSSSAFNRRVDKQATSIIRFFQPSS